MKKSFSILWVAMLVLLFPVQWAGIQPAAAHQQDLGQTVDRVDESEWDAFFDQQMSAFGVYGAEMVIVESGGISTVKAYGYADASTQAPMDPENTIIRAGSIVKTLTAMAVMQLVEQGKIDLDANVNDYLTSYQVPPVFDEPVTARQLLNMSGGFDTRWVGIRASSRETVRELGEYLGERMPPRVLPPGRYRRYNDHEYALAGLLVEDVSGLPYEQYVREHIFAPLEMQSSSILLPQAQEVRAARGYGVDAGVEGAYDLNYYYLNDAPGSGFNTTAMDMAHYMLAQLGDGSFTRGDGEVLQVLDSSSAMTLHSTAFRHDERLPGIAYGFDEIFYNGQRILRKNGGAPGMNNTLILIPQQNLGFYLFYNSEGYAMRNRWVDMVLEGYLGELHPSTTIEAPIGRLGDGEARAYTGLYMQISDYTSETTLVQVKALLSEDVWARVRPGQDGRILVGGREYTRVAPDAFQDPGDGDYVIFERDWRGKPAYLFASRSAYRRTPWYAAPAFQLGLLGVTVSIFLLASLMSLFGWRSGRGEGRLLSGLASAINLGFLVSLIVTLLPVATGGDVWQFSFDATPWLRFVLALPLVATALMAGLAVDLALAWKEGRYPRNTRLYNLLVLVAMLGFLYFLDTWNLLGWRF